MLDTLCKHHLSGAFTSGHETRVQGTPAVLSAAGSGERLPGSVRPTVVAPDPDRGPIRRDALGATGRAELAKLV